MGIVRTDKGIWIPFWTPQGKSYYNGVCPICNNKSSSGKKKNRCSLFVNNEGQVTAISCAHVPSDKPVDNGDIFYIHSLVEGEYKKYSKKLTQEDIDRLKEMTKKEMEKLNELDDMGFRKRSDEYHRYLFSLLVTNSDTRKHLLEKRRLDENAFRYFKSIPSDFGERISIASSLASKFGLRQGITIKKSKKTNEEFLVLNGPQEGFLIPFFDVNNLLVACQVADLSPNPKNKYWWFSSREQSSHSPYGYWKGDDNSRIVIIIEGGLKGYIVREYFKKHFNYRPHVITIAGVGNYKRAIEGICELADKLNVSKNELLVYTAYDMDKFELDKLEKQNIIRPEKQLLSGLREEGFYPSVLVWDENLKGLDDYLYVEKTPSVMQLLTYEEDNKDYIVVTDSVYISPATTKSHVARIYGTENLYEQFMQIREHMIYNRYLHKGKPVCEYSIKKVILTKGKAESLAPYFKKLDVKVEIIDIDELPHDEAA